MWSLDGRVTVTNMRSEVSVLSYLTIDPIVVSDVGTYHCTLENIISTSERTLTVTDVLCESSFTSVVYWASILYQYTILPVYILCQYTIPVYYTIPV